MALGRGRPPLRGPVEAVAVGAQSRGRREADDRCGDAAAFAVYPAAVVGFQVQVGSTEWDKNRHGETLGVTPQSIRMFSLAGGVVPKERY